MTAQIACECSYQGGRWGTAGESSYLLYDRGRQTWRGVVMPLPGHGLDSRLFSPATQLWPHDHVRELVRQGYVVLCIDGGAVTLWPSPAMNTIIDAAITAVLARFASKLPTERRTKVVGMGYSRGCDSWLNYMIHNPTKVAGIYGWAPSPDLDWIYSLAGYNPPWGVANIPDWTTEVNSSFGCNSSTYLTATAGWRMMPNAADFAGKCPISFVHAANDSLVPVAMSQAWIAAVNDPHVTLKVVPTGDHYLPFKQIDPTESAAFVNGLTWT